MTETLTPRRDGDAEYETWLRWRRLAATLVTAPNAIPLRAAASVGKFLSAARTKEEA